MRVLEPFFNGYDSNYSELRTRCRDILQQEDSLSEIVQLVGRDSLSEDQKVSWLLVVQSKARPDYRLHVYRQNVYDYTYTPGVIRSSYRFSLRLHEHTHYLPLLIALVAVAVSEFWHVYEVSSLYSCGETVTMELLELQPRRLLRLWH